MEPLKEPRLITGTKRKVTRVNDENGRLRTNGQKLAGPASANYLKIIHAIENGEQIDLDVYRDHNGKSDTLLMKLGILHIHLYPDSKELLFLRQFDDHVELIEINDHTPFEWPYAVEYFESRYKTILFQSQRDWEQNQKKQKSSLSDAVARLRQRPKTTSDKDSD